MQKIGLIAILITCFLFGIICGGAETNNTDIALKEEIEQFEEQITDKNNSYVPSVDIPESAIYSIGRKGEEIIDKAFDFGFGFIKNLFE